MNLKDAQRKYPTAQSFTFGDGRELCNELLSLVRIGKKRAACGALRDVGVVDPMPEVGRQDISLDWDGNPALVIETIEVTIRRFRDVDADFALAEGEDETLASWQLGHRAFFERNGGFDPEMELVCERFRLIADFAKVDG